MAPAVVRFASRFLLLGLLLLCGVQSNFYFLRLAVALNGYLDLGTGGLFADGRGQLVGISHGSHRTW